MAGYFFVTGMTAIEFPEGVQWNEGAKPVFTGPCAELLPVMIDNYPTIPRMWSECLSPSDCYRFMLSWPFDFILGGGTRPARREDTESLDSFNDWMDRIGPPDDLTPATFDFSFLSPDGKELLNLHDCLWNEQVEPEGGGELVSARALEERGVQTVKRPALLVRHKNKILARNRCRGVEL